MVVDENEAVMEDVLSFVTSAKIGDCTNEKVLATLRSEERRVGKECW